VNILPIADCRLPIAKSFAGRRLARCSHDGGEFVGFSKERGQFHCGQNPRLDEQFEPESGFIGFFLDRSDFCDELGLAARAATGAIVGRHGSSASQYLFGNNTPRVVVFWDFAAHLDDPQCKCFSSRLEFGGIHGMRLQTQSAIGNRQSANPK
jgi:hypothetical protein